MPRTDARLRRGGGRAARACLAALLIAASAAQGQEPLRVILYPGYGIDGAFVLDGRVVEARDAAAPEPEESRLTNLQRNLGTLVNDEQRGLGVTLTVGDHEYRTITDAEGYFRVEDRIEGLAPGWLRVGAQAASGDRGEGGLLMLPPENTRGLISDVDDTVLVSEVTDKAKLLSNSLRKNPLQREAVPGVAAFYRRLVARNPQPASAPVFYLSASPRQLQSNIQMFLDANGFPPGVLITKKVTGDSTGDPLLDQRAYKLEQFERLLARLPSLRFVLVGDDGEQDPEIFAELQARYPKRIEAVYVRRVHPDPKRPRFAHQRDLAEALARP